MASPTVRRRRLAAELRRLRESLGRTIDQVSEQIDWHPTKLSRVETGRRAVQPSDVRALLALYRVDEKQTEELLVLARQARQRSWWHKYGDAVPDSFEVYLGLEAEASSLRLYEGEFIPGLLQTPDYALAVHNAVQIGVPQAEIDRLIAVRMARQELLSDMPDLWMVINEHAIRRLVGGRDVMRPQLERLIEATSLRNLKLQVLPFSAGAHPAMGTSFHVLDFASATENVVYIEYTTGSMYLEKPGEIERYTMMFDHLRALALSPDETRSLITQAATDL